MHLRADKSKMYGQVGNPGNLESEGLWSLRGQGRGTSVFSPKPFSSLAEAHPIMGGIPFTPHLNVNHTKKHPPSQLLGCCLTKHLGTRA